MAALDNWVGREPQNLIEIQTPGGQRGVYVCRKCYDRIQGGKAPSIKIGGVECCMVYRGETRLYATCDHPDHELQDGETLYVRAEQY